MCHGSSVCGTDQILAVHPVLSGWASDAVDDGVWGVGWTWVLGEDVVDGHIRGGWSTQSRNGEHVHKPLCGGVKERGLKTGWGVAGTAKKRLGSSRWTQRRA